MKPLPSLVEREKPGLSQTLPFEKAPDRCQGCGAFAVHLQRWRECDEWDRPTMTVVVLCDRCTKKEIDRHARLYHRLQDAEPFPGSMAICLDCKLRDGVTCRSPLAKHNGGSGMLIDGARGFAGFLCGGPNAGFTRIYTVPPTSCAGKQPVTQVTE